MLMTPIRLYSQEKSPESIVVDHPRPLLATINLLEAKFGWQISYEDPPFEHEADLVDLSDAAFLSQHPGLRRLIPNGKHFEFHVPMVSNVHDPTEPLTQLIGAYALSGNPGLFGLTHSGALFHVEPVAVRKRDGRVVAAHSVLETKISFPSAERTAIATVEMVLSHVNEAAGVSIVDAGFGPFGPGPLGQVTVTEGAHDEIAKEVMVRLFEQINRDHIKKINEPRRLVWQMMYNADSKTYYFNMHAVSIQVPDAFGNKTRQPVQ
jgi:hypothetical protein